MSKSKLLTNSKELAELSSLLFHDLHSPIRGIQYYSSFLIEDYSEVLDESGVKYLQTLKVLGKRFERYLESLYEYFELGEAEIGNRKINLKKIIDEIVKRKKSDSKVIKLTYETEKLEVKCDFLHLKNILEILIDNSICFNNNDQIEIQISYKVINEKKHQFSIRDNGIGIEEKHWDEVFFLSRRLHSKSDFGGGSGFGLSIAKKIVDRYNGQIWINKSKEDVGTHIIFELSEKI